MSDISDLLNAYLDHELTDAERVSVEAALSESHELRADLAEMSATRSMLRALPDVEPRRPIGVDQRPATAVPSGHRPRRVAFAIAGVAAVWLVILSVGVSLGSLPVVPEIDQLAVQHASASTIDATFQPMTIDQMADDPAVLDDIGQGMTR